MPDLVVLRAGPQPEVLTAPPLLAVEILSPDDTSSDTQERARDYQGMGAGMVWIIDPKTRNPKTRSGRMCLGSEWIEATRLEAPSTPVYVDLPEIFSFIAGV